MGNGRRQSAATLGRIYPYRAAKQQAPVVAAADEEAMPDQVGQDGNQVGQDGNQVGHDGGN